MPPSDIIFDIVRVSIVEVVMCVVSLFAAVFSLVVVDGLRKRQLFDDIWERE